MKTILLKISILFLGLTLFNLKVAKSQCSGGTGAGALSPVPGTAYQTMTVASGNYYTFTVPATCIPTYYFSFCAADGGSASYDTQITILDNTGAYAGGYNDDNCGVQSYLSWTPTTGGTYRILINTYSCASTGATATLAYKYTSPGNMSFSSSTVAQASTAIVTKCDVDQEIISVQVVTTGGCNPLSLTQFQLAAGSSTSGTLADVSRIHIYYTGTSSTYSTSNEFVAGGTIVSGGTHTINGSQTLATGTNYFWVAYDINTAATTNNLVDASCTQITVAGVNQVPTTTSPAGTRQVNVCASYPGTSALGLKNWEKSDVGVTLTGGNVSAWADQSGAGITGNMNQGTAANRPSVVSSAVNFQDYIRFDGSNDILISANTFTGGTLFNTTDNTILMVKNLKAGLVDYKWETDPTNSWRVGMELSSNHQRFDFVDDNGGGKNDISITDIVNKDVIVGGVTDASTIALRLNGNADASIGNPGLTMNPGATIKPLNIGANDLGNPLYCQVDIAEVMTFNKKLSSSEFRRVETYLAIKYGITLSNNKATGSSYSYMGSDGTLIWNNHTGYHNYVIGIGRDNAAGNSGLNKLKSTSVSSLNGSTDVLTIANGNNFASPSAFGADKSFFICGSNAKTLASTTASITDLPSGIVTRLERVWVAQETGTVGTVTLQFNMSTVPGVSGTAGNNDLANVRLLIDADGVFAAGATLLAPSSYNNTTDIVEFQTDFVAGTGFYFTIGSTNFATSPLPVSLLDFKVDCVNNSNKISWGTASEINNDHFVIERSANGEVYTEIAFIKGNGNSNSNVNYEFVDRKVPEGISYYRLKQIDYNGESHIYNSIISKPCKSSKQPVLFNVWPNPNSGNFHINVYNTTDGEASMEIYNVSGQMVHSEKFIIDSDAYSKEMSQNFSSGLYSVVVRMGDHIITGKFIVE